MNLPKGKAGAKLEKVNYYEDSDIADEQVMVWDLRQINKITERGVASLRKSRSQQFLHLNEVAKDD